jgi:hypothetical protein
MDGIPNTPNDEQRPVIVCPTCGTALAGQARFCGACGAELPVAQAVQAPTFAEPPPAVAQAVQAPPQPPGKLCNWCRVVNTPDALMCSACGAKFPTPEGDEALERAARERIEDMRSDINKTRGSAWWPFRSR